MNRRASLLREIPDANREGVNGAGAVIVYANLHLAIQGRQVESSRKKREQYLVNLIGLKGIVYALQTFNRFQLLIDTQRTRQLLGAKTLLGKVIAG